MDVPSVEFQLVNQKALHLATFDRGFSDVCVAKDNCYLSPDDVVCASNPCFSLKTGGNGLKARVVTLEFEHGLGEGNNSSSWINALEDSFLEVADHLDALELFASLLNSIDEHVVVQCILSLR